MKITLNPLLELVFPKQQRCAACGAPDNAVLCGKCAGKLRAPQNVCPVCGRSAQGGLCSFCAAETGGIDGGAAAWDYSPVSAAVLTAIKFRDRHDYLPYCAQALAQACKTLPLQNIDAVVAVPCHWLRKFRRGFNQAEEMAKLTAQLLDKPYLPQALTRPGYARPASTYAVSDPRRAKNARKSFAVGSAQVNGLTLLLVDDVLTSGSTMRTCAALLKKAGAAGVYIAAAAAVPAPLDKPRQP